MIRPTTIFNTPAGKFGLDISMGVYRLARAGDIFHATLRYSRREVGRRPSPAISEDILTAIFNSAGRL